MNERRNLLQESLAAIERLQAKLEAGERTKHVPIAIVGAGCRYPGGVETPEALWGLVRDGVDAVAEVPRERWDVDAFYDPDPATPGKMVTRKGGFIKGVDRFDPQFFNISPREALTLDPQQRLLLETSWEALESAGVAPDRLMGSRTGVFVGVTSSEYGQITRETDATDVYAATGAALNAAAGRIAFTLGLQGPCISVDTACSSSLSAVHLACQSLRTGESDLALAGGVNVVLSPDAMVLFSKWGMMAPDGRCKTFDAAADGFVRAEGCGIVALKRLPDALEAGDPILALIRGSAVNSDGRSSGLTVPNGLAQQAAIRTALKSAGLSPADIDYVEAHGTGTQLGDPIEIEALGAVLREGRPSDRPVLIGSIKTNIGHSESASGIAGLLKVVMALQHEAIPPHLHFRVPNPGIAWSALPVRVPTELVPWPRGTRARRAGVSSFGFSGTNAHVVLEEAPRRASTTAQATTGRPQLIPISARGDGALRDLSGRLAADLAAAPQRSFEDVVATLQEGRAHLGQRIAVVASSGAELAERLGSYARREPLVDGAEGVTRPGEQPRIAFLLAGQGAQYAGMGRQLYEVEPVFRAVLDRAAEILEPILERPLLEVMFSAAQDGSPLNETAYTQPCLYVLQCALAELWRSWGVEPAIVTGHSVGEYAAACISGVFSFEDGLRLIAERARLMQALPSGGAMAAIFAAESVVRERLSSTGDLVAIAAVNGPEETVVSGEAGLVAALVGEFAAQGVRGRALEVSHAFHSRRLDPMLDALERRAREVVSTAPRIALISNVTGAPFRAGSAPDGRYWREHARRPVRFADCIASVRAAGATLLLEIGPHPTLLALAARAQPQATWRLCASMRRGRDEVAELRKAAAEAFAAGCVLRWPALRGGEVAQRVALPTYPFQRERFWISSGPRRSRSDRNDLHPLLGERIRLPGRSVQFVGRVSLELHEFLADHRVLGTTLLPGAAFMDMALAAGRQLGDMAVRDFGISAPLELRPGEEVRLHTGLVPEADGRWTLRISSAREGDALREEWLEHARCTLGPASTSAPPLHDGPALPATPEARDVSEYYQRLKAAGLDYGAAFRPLRSLAVGTRLASGLIESAAPGGGDGKGWILHPAALDGAFHLLGALLQPHDDAAEAPVYVPVGVDEIQSFGPAHGPLRALATLRSDPGDDGLVVADLQLDQERGAQVARVRGLQLRAVTAEGLARSIDSGGGRVQRLRLEWQEFQVPGTPQAQPLGQCLIVSKLRPIGEALAHAIAQFSGGARVLDPSETSASELHEAVTATGVDWVVLVAAMDPSRPEAVPTVAREVYEAGLGILQSIASRPRPPAFCLLTRGAQATGPGDDVDVVQAMLLGLTRSAATESPAARMMRIDLDAFASPDWRSVLDAMQRLVALEPEVALRNGRTMVPRLQPVRVPLVPDEKFRRVLRIPRRGSLDALTIVLEEVRTPGPGEVQIAIRAAGLNFRDVMNALGMYPGDPGSLGSECSGVVTAVGDGVAHLQPGDEVVALTVDCLADRVTTPATLVVAKPAEIGFAQAVTIPNAFLTAAHALCSVAGIQPGQRVLVHAAAGGVGLAALRIARRAGAEVIGTAGTPEKRARILAEGASHAFDSRSASFSQDVLRATGGQGVDIVLNALSGELIEAGLRCLRSDGCFVEIGKRGIWTPEAVGAQFPRVRYAIVDLSETIAQDASAVRRMLEDLVSSIAAGELDPLPVHAFDLEGAPAAFRFMAAARHVGKIVLLPGRASPALPQRLHSDGTYLVTGGLGGLGLAAAEWLAHNGAGHIVLLGRHGADASHAAALDRIGKTGAQVTIHIGDIGSPQDVDALWSDLLARSPRLRGVVHAAGRNDDAALDDQSMEHFEHVAHPKIDGAWHLHQKLAAVRLDFFVLYSSASALLGAPGQANYAAANAFLDALASHRRAHGLECTSVAWGAWSEVGMAARLDPAMRARWQRAGVGTISPAAGTAALAQTVAEGGANVAVLALDRSRFLRNAPLGSRALFGGCNESEPTPSDEPTGGGARFDRAALVAAGPEDRVEMLGHYVRGSVAKVLGFAKSGLDVTTPLTTLGLDSLMAVQLRNQFDSELRVSIPMAQLMRGPSVESLAMQLADLIADANDQRGDFEEGVL